jgi:6-phosphofructokinase 1
MAAAQPDRLAILVGGGPAPGINSVIAAATIRARLEGLDVIGIRDGFQWIMQGDIDHVKPLDFEAISRTHFRGGSLLGTARANPTTSSKLLENVIGSLQRLDVSQLITIGGDDTAFSAMKVQEQSAGRVRVVHVPKTIDNDLDLPPYVDTFGYQTARHYGVEIVKNLMVDAKTTSRWYFVVAMGRTAGHLALGIGKAAGATITLITEEFARPIRLKTIVDSLVAAIIKRQSMGRPDGVAVIAEGVSLAIDPADFESLQNAGRDAHGHIRLAEVNLGEILKQRAQARLRELGLQAALAEKNIGYELRCADPIPFDIEYTRDLGYCAAKYLIEGGSAAMISLQGGHFVPVPFTQMVDRETGRTRVRLVDINSTRYAIARRYMVRLRHDDFEDPAALALIAATAKMAPEQFRKEFEYLVAAEPAPLVLTGAGAQPHANS